VQSQNRRRTSHHDRYVAGRWNGSHGVAKLVSAQSIRPPRPLAWIAHDDGRSESAAWSANQDALARHGFCDQRSAPRNLWGETDILPQASNNRSAPPRAAGQYADLYGGDGRGQGL